MMNNKFKFSIIAMNCILMAILLIGCTNVDNINLPPNNGDERQIGNSLVFKDNSGYYYNSFMVDEDNVYIVLPNEAVFDQFVFVATETVPAIVLPAGDIITEGVIDLSDFVSPPSCKWIEDGDTINKKIVVLDFPVLTIDTPDSLPILSKTDRTEGCVMRLVTQNNEIQELGTAGIRGRGNSTWLQPKKPYNVKLDNKASILGMKKSKHWILLANAYYDRTQIHTLIAFEIARKTDFPWIPSGAHVELFMNGEYLGLYYLCEKIRAEEGKIEIQKNNADTPVDECGYLLESYVTVKDSFEISQIDFPFGFFHTGLFENTGESSVPCYLGWEIKEPDEILSQAHVNYIKDYLTKVEGLIMNSKTGEYRNYFDIESAINWWLVEEISQNEEASRTKNTYMYKSGGGSKFTIGPPWDFDAWTFGMFSVEQRTWNLNTTLYYSKLFDDPVFVERLKSKWAIYKPIWESEIPKYIEMQYSMIHRAAERNEKKWSHWNNFTKYPNTSYKDIIKEMKESFIEQLSLTDAKIRNI